MLDINKILVIDDVIPKNYQEYIKNTLYGINMPWALVLSATESTTLDPALNHLFYSRNPKYQTKYWGLVAPILYAAADKANIEINDVVKARSFLQLPVHPDLFPERQNAHVDLPIPHTVVLYYVNDSDGPTYLYKQTADKLHRDMGKNLIGDPIKVVEPKQGRVVIFNGLRYHAGSTPKQNLRCVINFDIV